MRLACLAVVAATLVSCGSPSEPRATDAPDRRDEATEWFLRSISSDELTINFVYNMSGVASGCERKGPAFADETDEKVTVIANKSVTLDRNRACTEEFAYVEESVTLDRPLGDRALVGCRPGNLQPSEDATCRDLERSREHGIFEFSPSPSG